MHSDSFFASFYKLGGTAVKRSTGQPYERELTIVIKVILQGRNNKHDIFTRIAGNHIQIGNVVTLDRQYELQSQPTQSLCQEYSSHS